MYYIYLLGADTRAAQNPWPIKCNNYSNAYNNNMQCTYVLIIIMRIKYTYRLVLAYAFLYDDEYSGFFLFFFI